jgi:Leucine-rich repeat (LRR) protein
MLTNHTCDCVSVATGRGLRGLNKLRFLRLDFNQISQISRGEIDSCFQLTSLDLSCNKISSLAVSMQPDALHPHILL